ncbi:hypothetical protein GGP41_009735 [Bipolaris sorokiniana]|uniref:Uncharacterized protein n=2 Tax=Cochliobolus sativus TaxID=45130 RepID=A0A8H5ZE60_COCSA|nr:hypothetical protein GGP41_009735 [Bipolaris sorokiniana]
MSMFQTTYRKRDRDVDEDSDCDEDRYTKKSRPAFANHTNNDQFHFQSQSTLPHRPFQTPSPPRLFTDIRSMTPVQSDHGILDSPDSIQDGFFCISRESSKMDYDIDMDDDADARSQPPESPAFSSFGSTFMRPPMLQPSLFNSDSATSNGRIPTPIHPCFRRGGMNGVGYPISGSAGGLDIDSIRVPPMQAPPPAWKGPKQGLDEDRSRRMPSPISEDDDIPDTPTAQTQSQLSRLCVSPASTTDAMDTETRPTTASPNTPRGRKRSGALTGMGRFSMGYRDDCEKCRQRVPGHYSHFLT